MSTARVLAIAHNHSVSEHPDMETSPCADVIDQLLPDLTGKLEFSLAVDDFLGKCDDGLEIRLPSELKAALRRAAAQKGMTTGAYVRLLIAASINGPDHIATLLVERLDMGPGSARNSAPDKQGR